jgi:hypothetical protein
MNKTGWVRMIHAHHGAWLIWCGSRYGSAWRALDRKSTPVVFTEESRAKRGSWIPGTRKVVTLGELDAILVGVVLQQASE